MTTTASKKIDVSFFEKKGHKLTLFSPGRGLAGGDAIEYIVTKGVIETPDGPVAAFSPGKARKLYDIKRFMQRGVIVLRGHHQDKKFFESQSGSFRLDGKCGKFFDFWGGSDNLLAFLKEHLIAHTLQPMRFTFTERQPGQDYMVIADPEFNNKLWTLLDDCYIGDMLGEPPPPPPAPRKSLLTERMKQELKDANGKPPKPLYKIFNPEGAGTWLLCALEENGDTLWAVCDVGQGYVEYGTVSLEELETVRGPRFKLHLERDLYFKGITKPFEELLDQDNLTTY